MENLPALQLFARSKALTTRLTECLIKAGGRVDANNSLLFPVHPRSSGSCNSSEQWLSVYSDATLENGETNVLSSNTDGSTCTNGRFNAVDYFKNLKTDLLGSCVVFAQRIPSTVYILDRIIPVLPRDLNPVIIAAQQTSGKGRSENVWESPLGCAMFSFPLIIPLSSKLGQTLSFVQHLVATACVLAVRKVPSYEDVDLRIKWPNDILTSNKIKIGGILVSSSILQQNAYCNVGIGLNVTNQKPTVCLKDLILKESERKKSELEYFTIEKFIARALTELEILLKDFALSGPSKFLPQYLKYWLHSNQSVNVRRLERDNSSEMLNGTIVGLDDYGFLLVRMESGDLWSVQSDGNRFDMMANLLLLSKYGETR